MIGIRRRKQYIVDRSLQLRFSRFTILLTFLTSILTAVAIFYTTVILLGGKLADVYPQGRLESIFRSVYATFFITMLVILPVIFYLSIIFSHRLAGPLPKIYQALKTIGDGNFDIRLTLRKKDHLRSLADAINEMAVKLQQREKNISK
jgi:methyl-accepting chemotaxis protein